MLDLRHLTLIDNLHDHAARFVTKSCEKCRLGPSAGFQAQELAALPARLQLVALLAYRLSIALQQ